VNTILRSIPVLKRDLSVYVKFVLLHAKKFSYFLVLVTQLAYYGYTGVKNYTIRQGCSFLQPCNKPPRSKNQDPQAESSLIFHVIIVIDSNIVVSVFTLE
jgi:hypothetical protein